MDGSENNGYFKLSWKLSILCLVLASLCFLGKGLLHKNFVETILAIVIMGATVAYYMYKNTTEKEVPDNRKLKRIIDPGLRNDLPTFSVEEIEKHKTQATGIWMSVGRAVYDVTKYVNDHPGGREILAAAGKPADIYWQLYPHHLKQDVVDAAEEYRIGNLDTGDKKETAIVSEKEDPYYANEPTRNSAMLANSLKPYCSEPPGNKLIEEFFQPNDMFYVRNHHAVPVVNLEKYRLEISVDGIAGSKTLTFGDLQTMFKAQEVACTLQCAGNRRTSFNKIRMTALAQYDHYAIGCAKWKGAKLPEVLRHAGLPEDYEKLGIRYVVFEGLDVAPENRPPFSVSVPIEKVMDPKGDCILAYEMNGKPITPDNGYPVRGLIPGFVAFRSCKWLAKVRASKTNIDAVWQQSFYKVTAPRPEIKSFDLLNLPEVFGWPVQSLICTPMNGTVTEKGCKSITVMGVAWAGFGMGIRRVDVSTDEGNTWEQAELEQLDQPMFRRWCWTKWKLLVPLPKALKSGMTMEIRVKAVDDAYNNQPERLEDIYNFRGCMNNTQHRVKVTIGT